MVSQRQEGMDRNCQHRNARSGISGRAIDGTIPALGVLMHQLTELQPRAAG